MSALQSIEEVNKLILVVDDDAMNLRMAEFILERQGYLVCKVESGMECLSFLKTSTPNLILLDVEMPMMSGIRTLEIIRETPEWADIPVMFLTAAADAGTVIEAGSLGIVDYVKKPFLKNAYYISMKLEGLKRQIGTHAAGIVISSEKLTNVIPVIKNSDNYLTGCTMEYLEDLGLLKMDFLAIKDLSILDSIIDGRAGNPGVIDV